jgi:phospholipid/cholesterol/gamma-HCH transport system ATP-binding protein
MLHEFDGDTAEAIRASLPQDLLAQADAGVFQPTAGAGGRHWDADGAPAGSSTAVLPASRGRS